MSEKQKLNRKIAICLDCHETKEIMARGLCGACYWKRKRNGQELPPKVRGTEKPASAGRSAPPLVPKSSPSPAGRPAEVQIPAGSGQVVPVTLRLAVEISVRVSCVAG